MCETILFFISRLWKMKPIVLVEVSLITVTEEEFERDMQKMSFDSFFLILLYFHNFFFFGLIINANNRNDVINRFDFLTNICS